MSKKNPSAKWQVGDLCYRKGEKCKITHIDFSTNPPSIIIQKLSDGSEINTEFAKLTKTNNNVNLQSSKKDKKQPSATKNTIQKRAYLKNILRQKIIVYRNIVTVGCGHSRCTNPFCKSNIDNEDKTYTAAEASILALKMVKNKCKNCAAFPRREITKTLIVAAPADIDEKKMIRDDMEGNDVNNVLKYRRNIESKQKEQNVSDGISGAVTVEDLMPYIKLLIPLNELQNILLNKYNKINFSTGNINKLYLKSTPINEILFDHLLVKIIKYLDYKQYPTLNLLSKAFKKIMKIHASIYNKYTLHIIANKALWDEENIQFVLNHQQKLLAIEAGHGTKINTKNVKKQYNNLSIIMAAFRPLHALKKHPMDIIKHINNNCISRDLHDSFFNWFKLNKLLIDYYQILTPNQTTYNMYTGNPFAAMFAPLNPNNITGNAPVDDEKYQDKQCKMMHMFLAKMYKNIMSLTIRNVRNIKLFEQVLQLNKLPKLFHLQFDLNINIYIAKLLSSYNLCNILSLTLYDVLKMKEEEDAGSRGGALLQYGNNYSHNRNIKKEDRNICEILNIIFKACKHLLSFYCALVPKLESLPAIAMFGGMARNNNNNHNYVKGTVIFPSSLQFIFLSQCDTFFNIDLSKCNDLISLYLLSDNNSVNATFNHLNIFNINHFIKWPKTEIKCLVFQQTKPQHIAIVNGRRLLPDFINHFYKYFNNIKKVKHEYRNKPNVRFIKYNTMPAFVTIDDNANTYNPINKNNDETVSIKQINQWTKSLDVDDVLSLQQKYLIIKNQSNNGTGTDVNDLWQILLKLSSNDNRIEMYENWFEIDVSLWIKNMFKSNQVSDVKLKL